MVDVLLLTIGVVAVQAGATCHIDSIVKYK